MSQIEENLTDDILEITSREELILLIKKLYLFFIY